MSLHLGTDEVLKEEIFRRRDADLTADYTAGIGDVPVPIETDGSTDLLSLSDLVYVRHPIPSRDVEFHWGKNTGVW